MLRENKITEAQTAKEEIEAAQRKDAKLREINRENNWNRDDNWEKRIFNHDWD